MKIIWEFDPDDLDDAEKLKLYHAALPMVLCMHDFERELHQKWHHGSQKGLARKMVDEIWELWNNCKAEHKLGEE
jgi:hypothetical protein